MSALTFPYPRPLLRRLGARLAGVIGRLNTYIDSRPMPRHHRLGGWLKVVSESG